MKQQLANLLNATAYRFYDLEEWLHGVQEDGDYNRNDVCVRIGDWLQDWADVFDLQLHEALRAALKDTDERELL